VYVHSFMYSNSLADPTHSTTIYVDTVYSLATSFYLILGVSKLDVQVYAFVPATLIFEPQSVGGVCDLEPIIDNFGREGVAW